MQIANNNKVYRHLEWDETPHTMVRDIRFYSSCRIFPDRIQLYPFLFAAKNNLKNLPLYCDILQLSYFVSFVRIALWLPWCIPPCSSIFPRLHALSPTVPPPTTPTHTQAQRGLDRPKVTQTWSEEGGRGRDGYSENKDSTEGTEKGEGTERWAETRGPWPPENKYEA